MNRRGFIATLTALAGIVLAKFKAPAAPRYVAGIDPALPGADHLAVYSTGKFNTTAFKRGKLLQPWPPSTKLTYTRTSDGLYRWLPASCPKDIGREKPCGTEPMPAYDILCLSASDCPMMDTYHLSIDKP